MFPRLLVLVAVGIAVAAQGQPRSTHEQPIPKQNAADQRAVAKTGTGNTNSIPNVKAIVKQDGSPDKQKSDDHSDENLAIQRKLASWTVGLVLVGILQALILAGTVWAVVNQTGSNQTIERAWVLVDVQSYARGAADNKAEIMHSSGTSGNSTGIFAALSCQNEGRSPAYIYEIIAKFRIVEILPPEPDFNVDDGDFVEYEPVILGIGQAHSHTKDMKWLAIAEGQGGHGKLSAIYGVVRYLDIFNKKREARFGYRIGPDRKLARLTSREYNKQT